MHWTCLSVFQHHDLSLHHVLALAPEDVRNIFSLLQNLPQNHLKSIILKSNFTSGSSSYQTILDDGLGGLKELESFGFIVADENSEALTVDFCDSMVDLWLKSRPSLQECLLSSPNLEKADTKSSMVKLNERRTPVGWRLHCLCSQFKRVSYNLESDMQSLFTLSLSL
ncbi:hypothetical protein C8J56DRAFT_982578 [Mycena floridula]|nr:hypothetical protein C8J56DRAFT_982578 [Mycena floridula]